MFFGVLGSLYARAEDGGTLPLGGPARRLLLAALISRPGQTVPAAMLVEDLWGGTPPATATKTLQSHIVRLRRDLSVAEDGGAVIVTDGPGYRLDVPPEAVDASRFEENVAAGSRALDHGDAETAARDLDAALAWWRGDAYAEFPDAEFAVGERIRLGELRSLAHERRIEARLQLGQDAALVGDIEARLAAEPYRERLWHQLLLALYRSGRQADALAAYQRARTLLLEELGVEPSPALRTLEARILAQDSDLLVPRARVADSAATASPTVGSGASRNGRRSAPCPYPGLAAYGEADAALFVAREKLTARLVGRLAETDLVVLTGPSGSGKSSLARAGLVPALRTGGLPDSASWRMSVVDVQRIPAPCSARQRDLLVVDQFEELYTLPEAPPAEHVDSTLAALLAAGTRVVLVLRADFYGRLAELPALSPRIEGATVLVPPLSEVELRRVVVEPARRVGLDVEPDLVDEVLADVGGQPGALPLVSVALASTWRNRDGTLLTVAGYRTGGGVRRALETTAEAAYLALSEQARADARRLLVRLATHESDRWTRRPLPRAAVQGIVDEGTLGFLAAQRLLIVSESRVELVHEALLDGWPRLREWLRERAARAEVAEAVASAARTWDSGGRQEADLYRGVRLQAALEWRDAEPGDLLPVEAAFLEASSEATRAELVAAQDRARREAHGRRRLRRLSALLTVVSVLAGAGLVVATRERASARAAALSADARRVAALSLTAPDLRTSLLLAATAYRLQDSVDTRGALLGALERNTAVRWRMPATGVPRFLGADDSGRTLWTMDHTFWIRRYDVAQRKLVASFPGRAVNLERVAPDGRTLVVSGVSPGPDTNGQRVSVLSATNGRLVTILPVDGSTGGNVNQVAFTRDGRWLAVVEGHQVSIPNSDPGVAPGNRIAVFDTTDYRRPPRWLQVDGTVAEVVAARDLLGVLTDAGHFEFVRPGDLRVVAQTRSRELAHRGTEPVPDVLSPDGRYLALTDGPNSVRVLDTAHLAAPLRALDTMDDALSAMTYSPHGDELAAISQNGRLDITRVRDGAVVQRADNAVPDLQTRLAWAPGPDGSLYAAGPDRQILSLEVSDTPRLLTPGTLALPLPDQVQVAGDLVGLTFPAAKGDYGPRPYALFDKRTGRVVRRLTLPLKPDQGQDPVSVDRAGRRLLVGYEDTDFSEHFALLDLPSGRVLSRVTPAAFPSDRGTFMGVMAPDGTTAAYATDDHEVSLLSLPSGRALHRYTVTFPGPVSKRLRVIPLAFAPDGQSVLVEGNDLFVQYAPPGQPELPGTAGVNAPPREQHYALLDLRSGRITATIGGFVNTAYPAFQAWSPDGKRVAVGTTSGTLRILDAHSLHPLGDLVQTAAGAVTSIDWSPDGSTLLVGGTDGTLGFWDAATMRPLAAPLRSQRKDVWWAWYQPSGDRIIGFRPSPSDNTAQNSGSLVPSGTTAPPALQMFTMPASPSAWLTQACQVAGDNLTPEEWNRYVGAGRAYRKAC